MKVLRMPAAKRAPDKEAGMKRPIPPHVLLAVAAAVFFGLLAGLLLVETAAADLLRYFGFGGPR